MKRVYLIPWILLILDVLLWTAALGFGFWGIWTGDERGNVAVLLGGFAIMIAFTLMIIAPEVEWSPPDKEDP